MRKFLNNLGLFAIALIASVFIYSNAQPNMDTTVTYKQIQKIKPLIIIDHATLQSPELAYEAVKPITKLITGLGPFSKLLQGQTLNVLIESNGGRVDLGYKIIKHLNELKYRIGFKLKCHIKTAASMAFTIMLSICDERVGLKGLFLMQHPVRYSNGVRTVKTKIDDLDINKSEARILGVKPSVWLALSKQDGDHVFTKEEIKKFKLVTSYED